MTSAASDGRQSNGRLGRGVSTMCSRTRQGGVSLILRVPNRPRKRRRAHPPMAPRKRANAPPDDLRFNKTLTLIVSNFSATPGFKGLPLIKALYSKPVVREAESIAQSPFAFVRIHSGHGTIDFAPSQRSGVARRCHGIGDGEPHQIAVPGQYEP